MTKVDVTGIILAGGKSSRMGTDKGILKISGQMVVEHILNALKPIVQETMIIANNDHYHHLGCPVYRDIYQNCGPMGGIYTGLTKSNTQYNLILSCDLPYITTQVLSTIISACEEYEVILPQYAKKTEPLCAVYSKSCIPIFKKLLEQKQWKMMNSLSYFACRKVYFEKTQAIERVFLNMNTPEEYNQLKNV